MPSKKKPSKGIGLKLYIVFWCLLAISFAFVIGSQLTQYEGLAHAEQEMLDKIAEENARTVRLEQDLEYHYSDEFVERIAREHLGFIRVDETIFINDGR